MNTLGHSAEWQRAVSGLYRLAGEEGEIANFDRRHSHINERADDPTTWPAQHKRKSVFL